MGARRFALLVVLFCSGCGAKTGLLIEDSGVAMDTAVDTMPDTIEDAPMCTPDPIRLERRGAQIFFAVDRSNSMADTIDGEDLPDGELRGSRWYTLRDALSAALAGSDPLLEIGAKFYPGIDAGMPDTPEQACGIDPGIDLEPGRNNVEPLLDFFNATVPGGGTPTASGLNEIGDYFASRPEPFVPRFVVLATDGGPNCNPDTGVPPGMCVCTGQPFQCDPTGPAMMFAPYNCLDEARTLAAVTAIASLGVPVYVVGIDDPTRPDLADVLDAMAIAGGRPREEGLGRRFYSVRRPEDLDEALMSITDNITRCVFTMAPRPAVDAVVEIRVGDAFVPRDPTRSEGWDFTEPDRSEVTLFGGACARAVASVDGVTAEILCDPR